MADHGDWDDLDDMDGVGGASAPADAGEAVEWGSASGFVEDDPFANMFTDEIVNVTASDWDVDADVLWGDDAEPQLGIDGPAAYDFPA
ncbi:hypothetical protein ACFC1I_18620 [Microbacterium sp. NPDC056044]|uniref:hypothetical protein n=1 Tax=Microbacterium sp. NPDC056044 TaxID=3345690 RepID=UPI0035D9457D